MSEIRFFVNCVPPTANHHHKRIVRIGGVARMADRPELVAAKATLDALFLPHQPLIPVFGACRLEIEMTWPWLQGDPKRVRALGRIPHAKKPDWDNAAKGIADALVRLRFLSDDNNIVDGRVQKWRGDEPGIRITLTPVGQEQVA